MRYRGQHVAVLRRGKATINWPDRIDDHAAVEGQEADVAIK